MPARNKSAGRDSRLTGKKSEKIPPEPNHSDFLNVGVWASDTFGRYVHDIVGILLIVFAFLALIAFFGLGSGSFLTWLGKDVLRPGFGWGSILIALAVGAGGVYYIRKKPGQSTPFPWRRIFAFEGIIFIVLALLAEMGGLSIERASAGYDGGIIGWGLADFLHLILGGLLSVVVLVVLLIIMIIDVLDGWSSISRWAASQADINAASFDVPERSSGSYDEKTTTVERPARARETLPAEYRKSFRVDEKPVERPLKPLVRDDNLPPLNILVDEQANRPDERYINQTAGLIEKTLAEFGIPAKVTGFRVGPTVTQFAVEPGFYEKPTSNGEQSMQKVRVAQIQALSKDLALALSAERLRIEAPVPGRSYVGIEVPNMRTSLVRLRPILESDTFLRKASQLSIALGRDVSGQPVVADLARMPHLLIAGTTGSGKSVSITAITACLVMSNSPDDLRIVMIDPKMVELMRFNGLPHLYGKVETEIERILGVLRWAMTEMDSRYKILESARARDLISYNQRMRRSNKPTLPRIVIIIDELADLMMTSPDQTEHCLVRLAQLARATGIHLILATQRPSTDVVTGLIKANFPARMSFTVASSVDSRVILDTVGAESLLGRGDMLFINPEIGSPVRVQGVMVTDQELEHIMEYWRTRFQGDENTSEKAPWEEVIYANEDGGDDALVDEAIEIVRKSRHASASLLQRRLRIGYPRAARLIDILEEMAIVGPSQGGGREREVLIEFEENEDGTEENDYYDN